MYEYNHMMDEWGGAYNQGNGLVSLLFMTAMVIFFIVAIVLLIRYLRHASQANSTPESAIEVLKRRYASGEVDKKQFDQTKKDLNNK